MDRVSVKAAKWPVPARQYPNPHTDVLEYLHVGTGVLPRSIGRDTEEKLAKILL
jgi:hypothetical protein